MAVKDWLPWVLLAGGGYLALRSFSGRGDGDSQVPVINAGSPAPVQFGDLIGAIGNIIGNLPQPGPINIEIPATPLDQAIDLFRPPVAAPVFETARVSDSGAAGAVVRRAVWEGVPVPEAVVTWVTTNRRGPMSNNSGRNFETQPLNAGERAQVRGAIGRGSSVSKELVDAFNAGQGRSESTNFLGLRQGAGVGADLSNLTSRQLQWLQEQGLNPIPSLPGVRGQLESAGKRASTVIGGALGGDLNLPLDLNLPKIPEVITNPDKAVKDAAKGAVSESLRSLERPLTGAVRSMEGAGTATGLASRIKFVGPLIKAIPGVAATTRVGSGLVLADLAATVYEFSTGKNLPVLGYREVLDQFQVPGSVLIPGSGLVNYGPGKVVAGWLRGLGR